MPKTSRLDTTLRVLLLATAVGMLGGCAGRPAAVQPDAAAPVAADAAQTDPSWPIGTHAFATTSGTIYLGNVDANIAEYRRIVVSRGLPVHMTALAGSLYHRFRVVGQIRDAEEAMALLEVATIAEPNTPQHFQLRAVVRSGFHRFDEALSDLDTAQRLGIAEKELASTRREIELALGNYAKLDTDFAQSSNLAADFYELAHRADLRVMQGDLAGASFLYRAAQTQYHDTNPVPMAWLHVQEGIALLRFGQVAQAREFFAAAHTRLPQYYLATEHLAECETLLGNVDAARVLYRDVIAQTGNAEFIAALSMLERKAGNVAEADRLQAQAEAGYETLLAKYPGAYAQHAAEFYIEIGKPERAYTLAQQNMTVRRDIGSWILLATAADAVGRTQEACEARGKVLATNLHPPEFTHLDALSRRCG